MAISFIQCQALKLAGSGSSIGDVTILVQSFADPNGNLIQSADLGTTNYGTLDPGNGTQEEPFQFTGVTQNANGTATLTGVSTILFKQPYTATSGLTKTHVGGATVIISNDAAFYNNIVNYINNTAASGAANASSSVSGIVQLATTAQINAGTATGSTGAALAMTPDQFAASQYASYFVPTGVVMPYACTGSPVGYLPCDGSAVSRSTYATLFGVVGTLWGAGDLSTTFNVPDLRSSMPLGAGTKTKTFTYASGTTTWTVTGMSNSSTNELQTGQAVTFHANGNTTTGLTDSTTYYLIRIAYNQVQFGVDLSHAQNANPVSTSAGTGGTPTFTITMTARSVGDTGGNETHAMSLTELLAHTNPNTYTSANGSGGGANGFAANGAGGGGNTGQTAYLQNASSGGNAAMPIMNPFTSVNYVIKT